MSDAAPPPRILVDGDACPVKDEVLKVAARHEWPVVIVSNGGLRPSRDPLIRHVVVPRTPDAADDWIAEEARPSDVVVTADIRLAARIIDIGAAVLGPDGRTFTPDSIGMAVAMRDLNQQLREAEIIGGGGRAFSRSDRSRFLSELDRLIVRQSRA